MRKSKPNDYTSKALAHFLELNENKLTVDIIIPLLKTMGFSKVDYHGGQGEKGKDIILWRYDELDEIELINVQVKIWKPSASSSSTQSFAGVITQLQQASEEHVEHVNGQKYLPSAVYFITPYEVDARSLNARFNKYSDLSHRRIRIIDGAKLAFLVNKHLPNLANDILGIKFAMQTVIKSKLNNLTLLRALDYSSEKNISRFYSDLDLTFGGITTNAFLNSKFDTSQHIEHILNVHTSDWPKFKSICLKLTTHYKHRLTIQSIETLNRKHHEVRKTTININKKTLNTFSIRINTNSLKRFFNKQKIWLKQQEKILNYEKSTINDYKNTFVECHKLLKFINELINHDLMNGIFKLERAIPTKTTNNSPLRICSPMNKIFSTHLNIAILGDAGAGKTTCLQMQAQHELESGSNRLVLFIPLAQAISHNTKTFQSPENEQSPKALINLLVNFFHTENVDLSNDELDKLLQENDSLLLFDGIDEVISKTPRILSSISLLSNLYPRSQIIISSRTGGKYLNEIKFLGLELLPFTNKQRDFFIKEWFENKKDPRIKLILDHVNSNTALQEIIKKPILATIMCVLAEHHVPLPKNELRLYQERMKLLTGHYDLHKQINRTKSTQDLLEKVARKLAFALHDSQNREDHIDNLIQIAVNALTPEECTEALVTQAVKELRYPCNVLLPTSHEDQLGFGLLRYQEYLVAQELLFNRSIPLKQFYNTTWWKEVIVIFAKMSGDSDYILNDILSSGSVTSSSDTFFAITTTLPHVEKMNYEALITDAIKKESDMEQRSSSR